VPNFLTGVNKKGRKNAPSFLVAHPITAAQKIKGEKEKGKNKFFLRDGERGKEGKRVTSPS